MVFGFLDKWKAKIIEDPTTFPEAEVEVTAQLKVFEGWLLACLLAHPKVGNVLQEKGEELRKNLGLRQGNLVTRSIQFLCGLVISVRCWYAAPVPIKRAGRSREQGRRGKEGAGLYPELALLGIQEGVSPNFRNEVTRQVIMLPSMELARTELKRQGLSLNIKKLFRVVHETGNFVLALRKKWLLSWRHGALPMGLELAGKRVAVASDGGRTRLREYPPQGRKTKSGKRKFTTPWREPKMFIIYVLDEQGKVDRTFCPVIDGTMKGPDALMELLAMHLHRLGAAKAKEGVFLGDGAEWIWLRTPWVMEKAGLEENRWHAVVDFFHVIQHVSEALEKAFPNDTATKNRQRGRLKKMLKRGELDEVINYLKRFPKKLGIAGEIAYLEFRRPLLRYDFLLKRRLPIGSGAIESAIRRVINLRLKAPGMFWKEESVEPMLL